MAEGGRLESGATNELLPFLTQQATDTLEGGVTTVPCSVHVEGQLVHPGHVRCHDDPMDLVQLAESVMKANQFIHATTLGKLTVVVDQIRALQATARDILRSAKRDTQLHHAACNFTKIPGQTYHLYEREDSESCYFSMLSPRDWGKDCPHQYRDSYRLEYDHSWTPLEEVTRHSKDSDRAIISRVLALPEPSQQCHSKHT